PAQLPPARVERPSALLQLPLRFEIPDPGHPRRHAPLRLLRLSHRRLPGRFRRPEEVDELAHRSRLMSRPSGAADSFRAAFQVICPYDVSIWRGRTFRAIQPARRGGHATL